MKEAKYYTKLKNKQVRCELCPNECVIDKGFTGACKVRKNLNGILYTNVYNNVSSINIDPIEKKPLYNFFPGTEVLSIGSFGCNLKCKFCQNYEISQEFKYISGRKIDSSHLIEKALEARVESIAFTYNEPTIWYEFMYDIAKESKKNNLKNIMVTNGYISEEPLKDIIPYIDAFSVDLKAFSEDFFVEYTNSHLNPVLNSLKNIRKHDKHLEIVFLVIPNLNDDVENFKTMIDWIIQNLGKDTPLHINRFHPAYKMKDISVTPVSTLENMYNIAKKNLNYVYIGNVAENKGRDTYCKECKKILISRQMFYVSFENIDNEGRCKNCNTKIETNGIILRK